MPEMPQSEIDALGGFRFLASQYGGSPQGVAKKIDDLEKDNRDQRQELKSAKEKLPKENEVVLPKERVDLLAEYEALGKPSELKAKLTTGDEAAQRLARVELRTSAAAFASAAGLAEEAVDTLIAIPDLQGAKFETRKGKSKDKAGKEVEVDVAYVTLPGAGQVPLEFTAAKEKVPALNGLRTAAPSMEKPAGRSFVPQGGQEQEQQKPPTEGKSAAEIAIDRIRDAHKGPSALRPAKAS